MTPGACQERRICGTARSPYTHVPPKKGQGTAPRMVQERIDALIARPIQLLPTGVMVRDEQGRCTQHGAVHPNEGILRDAQTRKESAQDSTQIIQRIRFAQLMQRTTDQLQFHGCLRKQSPKAKRQDENDQPRRYDKNEKGTQA
nr:hypothetical protein [Stutzerimonas nitrititolerans]